MWVTRDNILLVSHVVTASQAHSMYRHAGTSDWDDGKDQDTVWRLGRIARLSSHLRHVLRRTLGALAAVCERRASNKRSKLSQSGWKGGGQTRLK
ncbi:hypothetical protein J6590_018051 [Homalodisca vitripennis]|nr:hypothetical protein J6590_018051 [Homalodisca vitripennis]